MARPAASSALSLPLLYAENVTGDTWEERDGAARVGGSECMDVYGNRLTVFLPIQVASDRFVCVLNLNTCTLNTAQPL